jgi:hypothetical protein
VYYISQSSRNVASRGIKIWYAESYRAETSIGLNPPNFEIGLNVEKKVHRIWLQFGWCLSENFLSLARKYNILGLTWILSLEFMKLLAFIVYRIYKLLSPLEDVNYSRSQILYEIRFSNIWPITWFAINPLRYIEFYNSILVYFCPIVCLLVWLFSVIWRLWFRGLLPRWLFMQEIAKEYAVDSLWPQDQHTVG